MNSGFAGLDPDQLRRAGRMVVSIEGMWCASCAMAVERVMARVPGVTAVSASFAGGSALIRWDPERFQPGELFARVERLGYKLIPLLESDAVESRIDAEAKKVWMRLAVAVFFGMWSMLGSFALYIDSSLAGSDAGWWVALASCLTALPVVTWSALPFHRVAWRSLWAGVPGMDALISLGVLASCFLSVWQLMLGRSGIYVDTAVMLVTFMLCGRLIEIQARRRNSLAMTALRQVVPETARIVDADGQAREVPASQARVGELALVHAGERLSVDAIVITGESEVDRSMVNGESTPIQVRPGSAVEAGCVNLCSPITVRVKHSVGQRFIDRIGITMLEVFGSKSGVAMQAERFARALIPLALLLAGLVLCWDLWREKPAFHAALHALSILVAACPCAVGLSLPLAYSAAAGSAARAGILLRDPGSFEALAKAREFMFDKTGTLTKGELEVKHVIATAVGRGEVLRWASLAEGGVIHPVAAAINRAAPETTGSASGKARRHARGAQWRSDDGTREVLVGSPQWVVSRGVMLPDAPSTARDMRVEVAVDGEWIGAIVLGDTVRPLAADALAALAADGARLRLVTGDAAGPAMEVAEAVGLAPDMVHSACMPEQKLNLVLQGTRPTAFVGDGVNDALALAAADCGIAVAGASTAAVATAGVVIAHGGMDSIVAAWRLARRTSRIVQQNLGFSMAYNLVALTLSAQGMVPPVLAAAAMLASSLSVTLNAARLARLKPEEKTSVEGS